MKLEKNIIKLIDSICENFAQAMIDVESLKKNIWTPRNGITYCNFFVNGVCKRMGYLGFLVQGQDYPIMANDMIDLMLNPQNGWMVVDNYVAQAHANSGALVIAGQKEEGHGHVCMVRPGEMQASGNWGKKAPRVANIGKDVFINRAANWAFKTEPTYFVLKEMI